MSTPDPPYQAAPIQVKNREDEQRLPEVVASQDWINHYFTLSSDLNTKPTRKAVDRQGPLSVSIGLTPLPIDAVGAGLWRLTSYVQILVPGSVSGSVQVTLMWTKGGVVQTEILALLNGNLTTTHQFATVPIDVDENSPLSYQVTHATAGATPMEYAIVVMAEELAITRDLA